ncbi:MAG: hypothetical protein KDL87_09635, partial [Verrucomicrobiae bacterium]|nr:hypothetical protein [Verrucomicrobiae bacterium]
MAIVIGLVIALLDWRVLDVPVGRLWFRFSVLSPHDQTFGSGPASYIEPRKFNSYTNLFGQRPDSVG